jgi:hypothetical protein
MTLTLEQEALMLRVLDAEEAGTTYVLDAGEAGTREYVTVRALRSLELVDRQLVVDRNFDLVLSRRVRSTCKASWLHDALNVRERLRAAGLSTRSCLLRT